MRLIKKLCLFITPLFLLSNSPAFAYIEKDIAVLRVMNKAAGKTQIVPSAVNKTTQYDGLNIIVRNCKQSDPFDAENYFAFVEIQNCL